jgi:hypothetical protein
MDLAQRINDLSADWEYVCAHLTTVERSDSERFARRNRNPLYSDELLPMGTRLEQMWRGGAVLIRLVVPRRATVTGYRRDRKGNWRYKLQFDAASGCTLEEVSEAEVVAGLWRTLGPAHDRASGWRTML